MDCGLRLHAVKICCAIGRDSHAGVIAYVSGPKLAQSKGHLSITA